MVVENANILNLMSTYGPLLVGAMLSCVLYGMAVIQLFVYFSHYERDSIWMKLYVVLIWAIETASTACVLVALWPVLILKWGSLHELSLSQRPILGQHRVWMAGLGTFLVHMFYIYRIYMVNGRKPLLPSLLIPFTVYQMVETWGESQFDLIPRSVDVNDPFHWQSTLTQGGCIPNISYDINVNFTITSLKQVALSTLAGKTLTRRNRLTILILEVLGISGRVAIAFVDTAIPVLMVYALLKDGAPQFSGSRKIIFKLTALTINTGLWTAVFAIFVLVLYIPYQQELYYCAVDFPLAVLYLNSLLANLNAREYVRGGKTDVECTFNSYMLNGSPVPSPRFSPTRHATPTVATKVRAGPSDLRLGFGLGLGELIDGARWLTPWAWQNGVNVDIAARAKETHVKLSPDAVLDITKQKAKLRL
ncbi:hypothetical protein GSI_10332 [Ganoderma sinense ZZ0214-1]|uniref:DUF6534 domain-containing protein n=1 Tax=Ganoderma sinense ZZ0214-1 TaxID=1077348 RepID=A0A2G8S091_9APHY|nr:hypothetical protein GSI_10332 [Ganoderma sinense ZZ0214-1]